MADQLKQPPTLQEFYKHLKVRAVQAEWREGYDTKPYTVRFDNGVRIIFLIDATQGLRKQWRLTIYKKQSVLSAEQEHEIVEAFEVPVDIAMRNPVEGTDTEEFDGAQCAVVRYRWLVQRAG